jgi:hypothetical protein
MCIPDHLIAGRVYWLKILPSILILNILAMGILYGQQTEQTLPLFDGKSLQGWKTFPEEYQQLWRVEDNVIIGGDGIQKIPVNVYLHTEKEYGDFEFRCLFRLSGDPSTGMINSGIQYRSFIKDGNMVGYQADIGNGYWGDIYDEHRRATLVGGDLSTLKHLLQEDGWNSYIVRCKGNRHELYINGVKTTDYVEEDPNIPSKGIIAVQLHSGGNAQLELRDITITEFK